MKKLNFSMNKVCLASLFLMLTLMLQPGVASAQCASATPVEESANSIDGSTGSVWHLENRGRYGATVSFYIKPVSGSVEQYVWLDDDNSVSTYAPVGVRISPAGKLEFLVGWSESPPRTPTWGCGTRDRSSGYVSSTCLSISPGSWYKVEIEMEGYTRLVTYKAALCDNALNTYGTDFGYPFLSANAYNSKSQYTNDGMAPYIEKWKVINQYNPSDFEIANIQWNVHTDYTPGCYADSENGPYKTTARSAAYNGFAFSPCTSVNTTDFCAGQTDTTFDFNVSTSKTDNFSTVTTAGGCTGTIVGPHSIITAAHCITSQTQETMGFDPAIKGLDYVYGRDNSIQSNMVANHWDGSGPYPIYRMLTPRVESGLTGVGADIAILYTRDDVVLPPPYAELYDWEDPTQVADCTDLVVQGLSSGQCSVEMKYERLLVGTETDHQYNAGCYSNAEVIHQGGWSGGPMYALGDFDGDLTPEHRLIGPHSGGVPLIHYNSMTDDSIVPSSWFTAHKDGPPTPLKAFANGLEVWDVEVTLSSTDIDAEDIVATCSVTVQSTGDPPAYAGCKFGTDLIKSYKPTCFSFSNNNGIFQCDVVLPQNTGDQWGVDNVFVGNDEAFSGTLTDTTRVVTTDELVFRKGLIPKISRGQMGIEGSSIIRGPITLTNVFVMDTPTAPKGDILTYTRMSAPLAYTDDILLTSVQMSSPGEPQLYSSELYSLSAAPGNDDGFYTFVRVKDSASIGATYTADEVYLSDNWYRSSKLTGSFGSVDIYDCANASVDLTATNGVGTPPTSPGIFRGQDTGISFWARASVNNEAGYVLFAETAISSLSEAFLGAGFGPNGFISYLDNGVWVESTIPYTAGDWFKFTIIGSKITNPITTQATYEVSVEKCGSPKKFVGSGFIPNNGIRIYSGIEHYNAYSSSATQTIDVYGVDMQQFYCAKTFAVAEPWTCGTAPDGCGDVIVYGDTCGAGFHCQTDVSLADPFTCVPD